MPIEVNRPSDTKQNKAKLSKIGVMSLALLAVLVVSAAFMVMSGRNKAKLLAENAAVINTAVSHSIAVCTNVSSALDDKDAADKIGNMIKNINAQKDPLAKADMTVELIGTCLGMSGDRRDLTDELNGSRNRLLVAVREYKSKL